MGARVSFAGGKPRVTDGPFIETNEVVGGYWSIRTDSRQQAIDRASRCPALGHEVIEVRQLMDFDEFPPDIQQLTADFPALNQG